MNGTWFALYGVGYIWTFRYVFNFFRKVLGPSRCKRWDAMHADDWCFTTILAMVSNIFWPVLLPLFLVYYVGRTIGRVLPGELVTKWIKWYLTVDRMERKELLR